MTKTALVVLDMQNCFVKKSILPVRIKTHIQKSNYDVIVFSRFKNVKGSNFVKKLGWTSCQESPGTDIVEELSGLASHSKIFDKKTYSVFKAKGFLPFLRRNKITALYLCGVDVDACVLASAYEAFDLGYDVRVLKQLTESKSKVLGESAKKIIKRNLDKG